MVLLLNGLAAQSFACDIASTCREKVVLPSSVFAVMLAYRIPLDIVANITEKCYPVAPQSNVPQKKDDTGRNPAGDCALLRDTGRNLESKTCKFLPCIIAHFSSIAPEYVQEGSLPGRFRTVCFFSQLLLAWLIVLSLKNLPGALPLHPVTLNTAEGPSETRWAFSFGGTLSW
jgi:hypothetical protein